MREPVAGRPRAITSLVGVEAVIGGLVVFGLLAGLVLSMLNSEERATALTGPAAIAVWFVYLIHADTVVTAAYVTFGRLSFIPHTPALIAGIVVGGLGFVLFAWATRTLANRGEFQGLTARRLVVEGPYRFMRQPQNTGWAIMLLGVAIAGRSLVSLALVGIFAGFVMLLTRSEEGALEIAFGDDFLRWRDDTPVVGLPGAHPAAV